MKGSVYDSNEFKKRLQTFKKFGSNSKVTQNIDIDVDQYYDSNNNERDSSDYIDDVNSHEDVSLHTKKKYM